MSVRRPKFVLGAISILLTGAIASCSAPVDSVLNGLGEGNGDRVSVAGDAQEGIEGDSDKYGPIGSTKVAPGTLPPTGEPQPGHARLNSEGYYDYTADDFVLGDPCPRNIISRFTSDGYETNIPGNPQVIGNASAKICIANMNPMGLGAGIIIEPISVKAHQDNQKIRLFQHNGFSTYTVPLSTGEVGVCKAGLDTASGSRGILQDWGIESVAGDYTTACRLAHERLIKYIIGDS